TDSRANRAKTTSAQARSSGFLLMDSSSRPICANAEALRILSYPARQEETESIEKLVIEKVRAVLPKRPRSAQSTGLVEFTSGRRRYVCRFFPLALPSGNGSQRVTALLLERNPASLDIFRMAREFNLTPRECEAVEYLARGLTSKEIAERMGISPNTVRAFVRLAMVKTSSSTRLGIIGKFLQSRLPPS
ncbi:MAG TPA: LuxR C-terminal-related transcriptional regulator, partial [Candidatus Acidoferrales bacterium]|nr:LuxR C-terminal-related transcriptional regulator [Candidatus Acidoferrales bacterium]